MSNAIETRGEELGAMQFAEASMAGCEAFQQGMQSGAQVFLRGMLHGATMLEDSPDPIAFVELLEASCKPHFKAT